MEKLLGKLLAGFSSSTSSSSGSETLDQRQLHLAAACLLVEIGQADFSWQSEEIETVKERLQIQYELEPEEADTLFEEALKHNDAQSSMHPVVDILNEHCNAGQKRQIIEDCWRVAYADGVLDKYEEHHIRKLAEWLYVSHEDFIKTKLAAAEAARQS